MPSWSMRRSAGCQGNTRGLSDAHLYHVETHNGAGAIRPFFLLYTVMPERKYFVTNAEKNYIIQHRQAGKSCNEIARELGLSANTVKSFCRRNNIAPVEQAASIKTAEGTCDQCGAKVARQAHRKAKRFCSDACRLSWWHAHRELAGNAAERRCSYCGIIFHSVREQKYCSRTCYFSARYGSAADPQQDSTPLERGI